MSAWPDPDAPPLDVQVVARAIAAEVFRVYGVREVEAHGRGREAVVFDRVVEILRAYDEGRTRTIAFYRDEMRRLVDCIPGPYRVPASEVAVEVAASPEPAATPAEPGKK